MERNQPLYGETPFVSYTVCVNHRLEKGGKLYCASRHTCQKTMSYEGKMCGVQGRVFHTKTYYFCASQGK